MAYNLNPATDACYEGTTCLINKLNIHDEAKLVEIEAQITFAKTAMLEESPINGDFDFDHYKRIHRFLLEDLYDWAGQFSKIPSHALTSNPLFCKCFAQSRPSRFRFRDGLFFVFSDAIFEG